ncbi:MAG: hypothetical protein DRI24_06790 [Deltaproteobacteria bacterium]|nr:MAG: hypothetical protein DRI24_06790 [Deltaproteobacteria bacterium]
MIESFLVHNLFRIENLVFWARSVAVGYADGGNCLNPKHEIRNSKQYPMTQIGMIKTNRITFKPMDNVWVI